MPFTAEQARRYRKNNRELRNETVRRYLRRKELGLVQPADPRGGPRPGGSNGRPRKSKHS